MRILVITRGAWRKDDSIGNTCSTIFEPLKEAEIYSLCMRDELPNNDTAIKNFAISEGQLIKNILKRKDVGVYTENSEKTNTNSNEEKTYRLAKKLNWTILAYARELLWDLADWKNNNLRMFLDDVSPDIVFMPVFNCYYPHKLLRYIKSYTNAKIVLFHADDNYTLKQFSLSPIYWLYRIGLRHHVRRSVQISDINYCISDLQKKEYEKAFGRECKLLTKYADFNQSVFKNQTVEFPLQLVYTGNINVNRWKSLAKIADVLKHLNEHEILAQLRIYTSTDISPDMRKKLQIENTSFLMGAVSYEEVVRIQEQADILVHVESLNLKHRLVVRQSFSTKIVDYLRANKPILAFGPKKVASISHLIENECAIVADNKEELLKELQACVQDLTILNELAEKAYLCGLKHHNQDDILKMVQNDFTELLNK